MIANALPRPLTAGSVDNAILRADGTDGTILQSSSLIVDDAVVPYSVLGDAATDVITATGHIYTANQTVIFSAITGGAGLSVNTVYFVRNPSGNTFQLSTTSGGSAINFTTNITAGTVIAIQANVAISQNTTETNSSLVLTPKGTGALLANKPNGAASGGNARGVNAVDLQLLRETASQVASGAQSFVVNYSNTASGQASAAFGYASTASAFAAFACGNSAAGGSYAFSCGQNGGTGASGANSAVVGGTSNRSTQTSAITLGGSTNTADATNAVAAGDNTYCPGNTAFGIGQRALGDRLRMFAHASGQFAAFGDAQRVRFVMRNKTTTNSAVELFLDGSATRLTIPSGKVLGLTINICGISSTGAAVAHYMRQYALKNVSGTTSEVYAPITIGTDNAAGTSIALSASDAADALVVSVTGTASTIWRWVASVDAVEITFGI